MDSNPTVTMLERLVEDIPPKMAEYIIWLAKNTDAADMIVGKTRVNGAKAKELSKQLIGLGYFESAVLVMYQQESPEALCHDASDAELSQLEENSYAGKK